MSESSSQNPSLLRSLTHRVIKGRGTDTNPANRFEEIEIESDPEYDPREDASLKTVYYKDATKSIITYNDSPDVGFDAGINPYRGCEHGCVYCYARPGHEYFGLSLGLDFETKIFVKDRAPDLLRNELASKRWNPQVISLSGYTDAYQPIERTLGLSRKCLEVLLDFRNPVVIITKNRLVTRDIDLLKELQTYQACGVFISVTTLDRALLRKMEPRASSVDERLKAIEQLRQAGIPVGVMCAPVIPGLTDHELPQILQRAADAGAERAGYVVLRLPYQLREIFRHWLIEHFPNKETKVFNRLLSLRKGKAYDADYAHRMSGEGAFAEQIRGLFYAGCKKAGIKNKPLGLSVAFFRNAEEKQYHLFDGNI